MRALSEVVAASRPNAFASVIESTSSGG
jgi:hypothetical protein